MSDFTYLVIVQESNITFNTVDPINRKKHELSTLNVEGDIISSCDIDDCKMVLGLWSGHIVFLKVSLKTVQFVTTKIAEASGAITHIKFVRNGSYLVVIDSLEHLFLVKIDYNTTPKKTFKKSLYAEPFSPTFTCKSIYYDNIKRMEFEKDEIFSSGIGESIFECGTNNMGNRVFYSRDQKPVKITQIFEQENRLVFVDSNGLVHFIHFKEQKKSKNLKISKMNSKYTGDVELDYISYLKTHNVIFLIFG